MFYLISNANHSYATQKIFLFLSLWWEGRRGRGVADYAAQHFIRGLDAKMTSVLQAKRELVAVKQARLSLAQDEYRDDPPPLAVSYHINQLLQILVVKTWVLSSNCFCFAQCSGFRIKTSRLQNTACSRTF
jgi:hypothetical protein